jgi:pimeloyl-ACP methyl ester carboxylesterase
VRGLVSGAGYNIQDIPGSSQPAAPENEFRYWYQYYFHGERGRAGLERNRRELCKLLWKLWSPNWRFHAATYERSAESFENPDFVPVVIHSYRHRYRLVPGDPAVEDTEGRLTAQPRITVPTVALDGGGDGVMPVGGSGQDYRFFTGKYMRRVIPQVGHNLPQEAPEDFAAVRCFGQTEDMGCLQIRAGRAGASLPLRCADCACWSSHCRLMRRIQMAIFDGS